MKTLVTTTALMMILSLSTMLQANTPPLMTDLVEEEYIDDIPFDTQRIFDSLCDCALIEQYDLPEEAYIDDIPFEKDHGTVADESSESRRFDLPDEEYIDDIPFSTRRMVRG